MLLNTFAAIAQEESVAISQNLRLSIRKRMADGTYISSSTPYGYNRNDKQELTVSEIEAKIVKRIFGEYLSGKSTVEIANELNRDGVKTTMKDAKWWPTAITYILTNESFIGNTLLQKTYTSVELPFKRMKNHGVEDQYYVKDSHVPIIGEEKFRAANELLTERRDRFARNKGKNKYLLTSIIVCSGCGSKFKRRIIDGEIYWACSTKLTDKQKCNSHYLKERVILGALVSMLNKLRFDDNILLHTEQLLSDAVTVSRRSSSMAAGANKSIAELNTKLLNIEKLRSKGYLAPEICQAQSKVIEKELSRLKEKRQKIYNTKLSAALEEVQKLRAVINKIEEPLENIDERLFSDVIKGLSVNADNVLTIKIPCGLCFEERL